MGILQVCVYIYIYKFFTKKAILSSSTIKKRGTLRLVNYNFVTQLTLLGFLIESTI